MTNTRILLAAVLAAVTLSASAAYAADAMPTADASATVTTQAPSMDHKAPVVKKHHKKAKKAAVKAQVKADAAK